MKSNLIKIFIGFISLTLFYSLLDFMFGDDVDWGLNMFVAIFLIGLFLLFGGLLRKAHTRE